MGREGGPMGTLAGLSPDDRHWQPARCANGPVCGGATHHTTTAWCQMSAAAVQPPSPTPQNQRHPFQRRKKRELHH